MRYKPETVDQIAPYLQAVELGHVPNLNCCSFATEFYRRVYDVDFMAGILDVAGIDRTKILNHMDLLKAYITLEEVYGGREKYAISQGFKKLTNNFDATRGDLVFISELPNMGLVCDGRVYVYSALGLSSSKLTTNSNFNIFTLKEIN